MISFTLGNEIDSPVSPVKSWTVSPSPQQTASTVECKTPVGRRGRFANLAATINSWDDDMSHPIIKHNKSSGQPGTACLPVSSATNKAPPTIDSSCTNQQAVISTQRPPENTVNKINSTAIQVSEDIYKRTQESL